MSDDVQVFSTLPAGFRKISSKYSWAAHGPRADVCRSNCDGYICSRTIGHKGRHEAGIHYGSPAVIVAVWDAQ